MDARIVLAGGRYETVLFFRRLPPATTDGNSKAHFVSF
jgi:hypothetical protein